MKVAPVSADLLVKIALGALVAGALLYAVRRASAGAGDLAAKAWDTATGAAWAVAPWNQDNVIYGTANNAISAATGRDETLGGWLYSVTHPDPVATATGANNTNTADPTGNGTGDGSYLDLFNQANSY
jgi:hypothetical protein